MTSTIALYTDFGAQGPYLGQMQAGLLVAAPGVPVVVLQADAPPMNPRAAAYLLAAQVAYLPPASVCVAVVDPGVGSERQALLAQADGRWFVGPDNGLLAPTLRHAREARLWRIDWRPDRLSASFHGRDLFAPVAARLARGEAVERTPLAPESMVGADWPAELPELIYIDHYGNAFTGLRASGALRAAWLMVGTHRIPPARVYAELSPGTPFWYENSSGLVEIAVSLGRADLQLGLRIGDVVRFD